MNLPPAFRAWMRPRTRGLVEEAERLDVPTLLAALSLAERRTLRAWSPPEYPGTRLVRARRGALDPYWMFECAGCGRRREALYRPPGEREWRCRTCHGLIFASHRYASPRHPARQRPPYRTRVKREREARRRPRLIATLRRLLSERPPSLAGPPPRTAEELLAADLPANLRFLLASGGIEAVTTDALARALRVLRPPRPTPPTPSRRRPAKSAAPMVPESPRGAVVEAAEAIDTPTTLTVAQRPAPKRDDLGAQAAALTERLASLRRRLGDE